MMVARIELCHCGRPLHYTNKTVEAQVRQMIAKHGEYVKVTVAGVTYSVQRHYIALHGVKAWELPKLGFEIVENE